MFTGPTRFPQALSAVIVVLMMAGTATAQILPPLPAPDNVPVSVPFTGIQTVYGEDFNADDGTWSAVTDSPPRSSWEWGAPTSGPGGAASGSNAWATRLGGDYMHAECGALLSPPLTIPAGASASASFKEWRHLESSSTIAWDAGLLFVTGDDGTTFTKVTPDIGYTSPGISTSVRACLWSQPTGTPGLSGPPGATPPAPGYSDVSVDLSAFAGQTVRVAIAFGSDSAVTRAGWYVDDFAFEADGVPAQVFDFEEDDGGFTAIEWSPTGAEPKGWSWGIPSTGPDAGPGSFAMWSTDPGGDHGNNECSFIESEPIDLSLIAGSNAFLEWRQWYRGNFGAGGVVQVGDGTGYTNLVPVGGYGSSNPSTSVDACLEHALQGSGGFSGNIDAIGGPLRNYQADISEWLGQTVTIRYLFAANPTVKAQPGWYVDDVRVVAGVGGQEETIDLPAGPSEDEAGVFVPVVNVYQEDFNFDAGGWTEEGTGAWQWGDTEAPPEHLPGSIRLWGTRLTSEYDANECSILTSAPITVPGVDVDAGITTARLSFHMWRHIQNLYDAVHLVASDDGGETWTRLVPDGGYTGTLSTSSLAAPARDCLGVGSGDGVWTGPNTAPAADEWDNVTVDLSAFMGQEVRLRFVLGTSSSTHYRGAYVDNVVVQAGGGAGSSVIDQCDMLPGWAVTGTEPSWCHGVPTTGPVTTRTTWATNLHGPYNRGECSAIEYGPIDTSLIPGLGTLELRFNHYFRGQGTTTAGGVVQVSRDEGATWDIVNPTNGYPGNLGTTPRGCLAPGASSQAGFRGSMSGYEERHVLLRDYQDETLMFRFAFASSTGTPNTGWYLNNIGISRGAGTVPLTPLSGEEDPLPLPSPLREKADAALLRTIRDGEQEDLEMMVLGAPHAHVGTMGLETRAEAMQELDSRSAPFFERVTEIVKSNGGEVLGMWSAGPVVKVRADLKTATALAEQEEVQKIDEDGEDKVRLVEPIPGETFSPTNTQGRQLLQAEDIWAAGFRGDGVAIAVIDTGVDAAHEAFKYANGTSRIAKWANCITSGSDCSSAGTSFDDHGHGTHVSGTALGNNLYDDPVYGAFQEVGVAPNATLYSVKFLNGGGGGTFADAIKSLQWSFDNGADLTSNSWGGSCSASGSVVQVVNTLTSLGMLSVFAAGNSGSGSSTIGGPACADTALSVGAVDNGKNIASFSSRGPCSDPTTGTGSRVCPDVVAKGVDVRSAIPRSGAGNADPSGYKIWDGTSMATPHIAGAVALIEEMKRHFTGSGWDTASEAEKEVLKMTALDLGVAGEDNVYGWGLPQLLSVYALLNSQDEANIVSSFSISKDPVRLGESTTLSFSVRNLGGATASGPFLATLEDPDGAVTTLHAANVSLALLDGEVMAHVVTVSGNVAPGTYTFRGSFDYSWTDPGTGNVTHDSVAHAGTFDVKRVFMDFDVDLAPEAPLLRPQTVTVAATNTGNEDARAVRVEFTIPSAYILPPGAYADPEPDRVHEDPNFGRTTLIYEVGDLAVGDTFSFAVTMLPKEVGPHTFIGAVKFQDGGGKGFTQGEAHRQTVVVA